MRRVLVVALAGVLLAACAEPIAPEHTEHYYFTTVVDHTQKADQYRVGGTAEGVAWTPEHRQSASDQPFNTVTVPIQTTDKNGNQFPFHPIVTIRWSDGTTEECTETDLRRYPEIDQSTFEVPCNYLQDATGAVLTVTDDWN